MELKFTMKYIEKIIKSKNIKQFNLIFYNLIKKYLINFLIKKLFLKPKILNV